MSNKYKHGDRVPTKVLVARLNELSDNITKGDLSQFVMRIPAELDHCPDLVLSTAAMRLNKIEEAICVFAREELGGMGFESDNEAIEYFLSFCE